MKKMAFFLLLPLFCQGCSSSRERCVQKGQKIALAIASDLSEVQSREDLLAIESELKRKFTKMALLALSAPSEGEASENIAKSSKASDLLKQELIRIYEEIEGGKEIVERSQKEALYLLATRLNERP